MDFPKTMKEYWDLPREDREALFKEHGFGWKTIAEGTRFTGENIGEKNGQIKLDFTE